MKNPWKIDWGFIVRKYGEKFSAKPESEAVVKAELKGIHDNIFVDVGAYPGDYTFLFWKNFQRTIAIEPNPVFADYIESRMGFRQRRRIEVHRIALSDYDGVIDFYPDSMGVCTGGYTVEPGAVYRPPSLPGIEKTVISSLLPVRVPCRRFDSLPLPRRTGLVKVDVEMAEFRVLEGMKRTLVSGGIHHLVVELHDRERKKELESIFQDYGFDYRWLDPDHIHGVRP